MCALNNSKSDLVTDTIRSQIDFCWKITASTHTTLAETIEASNNNMLSRLVSSAITRHAKHVRTLATFDKVGVIGLGLMGHGICQAAAMVNNNSQIVAFENEQRFLDGGKTRIENSLNAMVKKERISREDADAVLNRIVFTTDVTQIADADFIVEAVIENIDLKKSLYSQLGAECKPETIFASNTSSLSITEMAESSGRPDKFVGVHFFNPVQLMKLVEVVRTEHTNPDVYAKAFEWVQEVGKVAVACNDTPGFIVNRLLVPSLMQAMAMVRSKCAPN